MKTLAERLKEKKKKNPKTVAEKAKRRAHDAKWRKIYRSGK